MGAVLLKIFFAYAFASGDGLDEKRFQRELNDLEELSISVRSSAPVRIDEPQEISSPTKGPRPEKNKKGKRRNKRSSARGFDFESEFSSDSW